MLCVNSNFAGLMGDTSCELPSFPLGAGPANIVRSGIGKRVAGKEQQLSDICQREWDSFNKLQVPILPLEVDSALCKVRMHVLRQRQHVSKGSSITLR